MQSKKVLWLVFVALLLISLVSAFIFRPMTMNDIYNKPNFTGTVTEVYNKSMLVLVDEDEDEFASSNKMDVSLDVKLKDSMTRFDPGDRVKVFYDGTIAESYPAQINNVYAILMPTDEE